MSFYTSTGSGMIPPVHDQTPTGTGRQTREYMEEVYMRTIGYSMGIYYRDILWDIQYQLKNLYWYIGIFHRLILGTWRQTWKFSGNKNTLNNGNMNGQTLGAMACQSVSSGNDWNNDHLVWTWLTTIRLKRGQGMERWITTWHTSYHVYWLYSWIYCCIMVGYICCIMVCTITTSMIILWILPPNKNNTPLIGPK
jgi:hypothetical protein